MRSFAPFAPFALSLLHVACSSGSTPTPPADASTDGSADVSRDAATDAPTAPPLSATTNRGAVLGRISDGVTRYLGIPYAAPPVGELRWRAPAEHAPWSTPREAFEKGPTCLQQRGTLAGTAPMSEDCLFLNVWTPKTRATDATRRPVMLFIHGGGFTAGTTSGPDYDGVSLAAKGVVVVTFNYRLAQFGFLAHPALTMEDAEHHSSGNYGLMDQQAAMRWVRDNIAAFGGDPANVTLFGESAGGVSVCAHMTAPASAGLFHKAISESGPAAFLITPLRDVPSLPMLPSAESLGRRFETAIGCAGNADVPRCMREAPADRVVTAAPTPVELSRYGVRYQPNVDGYVLREAPWAAFLAGRFMRVPFVLGTNRDEGTAFTLTTEIPDATAYENLVRTILPDRVADVLRLFPAAMYPTPKAAYEAFLAEAVFICPARAQARVVSAANVPTYLYHFTRENRAGMLLGLGVFHSAELPYVFGNFTGFFSRAPEDEPVVAVTQGYWTRFATTNDPNGMGAVMWPRFTATNDTHLEIGDRVRADTGLRRDHCDAMSAWITPPAMP